MAGGVIELVTSPRQGASQTQNMLASCQLSLMQSHNVHVLRMERLCSKLLYVLHRPLQQRHTMQRYERHGKAHIARGLTVKVHEVVALRVTQGACMPYRHLYSIGSILQTLNPALQAAYSMGYGAQAASNNPYGAAFPQGAAFAQGSTGLQSGQKRDSTYDQASTVFGWDRCRRTSVQRMHVLHLIHQVLALLCNVCAA